MHLSIRSESCRANDCFPVAKEFDELACSVRQKQIFKISTQDLYAEARKWDRHDPPRGNRFCSSNLDTIRTYSDGEGASRSVAHLVGSTGPTHTVDWALLWVPRYTSVIEVSVRSKDVEGADERCAQLGDSFPSTTSTPSFTRVVQHISGSGAKSIWAVRFLRL